MGKDFFKEQGGGARPERLHDFDIPSALGGGVMVVRELYASEYSELLKQASRGLADGTDGGRQANMVEMYAAMGTNRKGLMRVACIKSIAAVEAWNHPDGADGFIEAQSPKMVSLMDMAIDHLHELNDEEEAGFISSHRAHGRPAATSSPPENEPAAQ
jgi:hypothetical protein